MPRLKNRIALVTGAAAGSGRAAAQLFASEGATVVLCDIDADGVRAASEEITEHGGRASALHVDITDETSVADAFDRAREQHGRLDVLFNCAGGSSLRDTLVTELPIEVFTSTVDLNLRGTVLCCRAGLPLLRASGGGSVINVASAVARRGGIWPSDAYTAAKAGVIALSRSMAANYAQFGIRVNVISPGMVRSERILRGSYGVSGTLNTGDITPVSIDFARYPFAVGDPVDLANVALFLASDESRMITGANIDADGGMSAY